MEQNEEKMKMELISRFHQAVNLMICDTKEPRSYGTSHMLTYSDISFLKCIESNQEYKAGELSRLLGITNGAVAQLAGKLMQKGYVESYRLSGNKKEVYYRLTEEGHQACRGYDRRNAMINRRVEAYLQLLDQMTMEKIQGLFEAMITSIEMEKDCYLKNDKDGRCEKCKTTC